VEGGVDAVVDHDTASRGVGSEEAVARLERVFRDPDDLAAVPDGAAAVILQKSA
jgi:hypothetical protein